MTDPERESRIVALLTEVQLPLRLYVRSLLPGDPAASDVAQQANATLWLKRGEFTLGTNFKAWAFSVARYEVLNYRKRQARDARLVFSERLEETFAEDLAGQTEDTERKHEALKRCLANLRGKDRELLMQRYASAGTLAAYAERTGQSAGGLKVTLHRLRNALLACIRGQLQQTEEMT
ncbi:MAG: sigma-70 family RNA polymerase sigma factor [Opitutaceae bacterium]|nr:sigma-70 family RNA polymerase sigma factor [Opitutaceae bacterium]